MSPPSVATGTHLKFHSTLLETALLHFAVIVKDSSGSACTMCLNPMSYPSPNHELSVSAFDIQ